MPDAVPQRRADSLSSSDNHREVEGVMEAAGSVDWYCTQHGASFSLTSSGLACASGHQVPLRNGIPRFVEGSTYADAFGEQWNFFRRTQLDSYSGLPISRTRLRRCLGEDLWSRLRGSRVLECGCGAGRFTEVLLAEGAHVVSIDLSHAVDANVANCGLNASHAVAQADIRYLPFRPQSFDIVICLGVIQHTPSSEEALAALYSQVAPGGSMVVDHYRLVVGWYTKTAPLFHQVLKRLPADTSLRFTNRMVDALLPLHKKTASIKPLYSLLAHISPVLSYYRDLPELSEELQWEWARLDTHDYLTDWYKRFRTPSQFRRSLEELGATDIWCEIGGNGIEARVKRPAR